MNNDLWYVLVQHWDEDCCDYSEVDFLHPQKLPLIMLRSFLMTSVPAMKQTTMKLKKPLVVVVAGVWKPIQRSRSLITTVRMLSLASCTKSGK